MLNSKIQLNGLIIILFDMLFMFSICAFETLRCSFSQIVCKNSDLLWWICTYLMVVYFCWMLICRCWHTYQKMVCAIIFPHVGMSNESKFVDLQTWSRLNYIILGQFNNETKWIDPYRSVICVNLVCGPVWFFFIT